MATVTDTAARERWEQEERRRAHSAAAAHHRQQRAHRRALHARKPRRLRSRTPTSAIPASIRSRAACMPPCTAAGSGPCGSSPASARRGRPTSASSSCSTRARPASSTAFDLPTLMGLDSDDPRSLGEVGRLGVAVDTLDDMAELFDGIDLAEVSVSMTINAPAAIVMAFFLANAQDQGVDWKQLRGTIQNDILKEFHAQNEFVFPPEPPVRLVCDVIEFCAEQVPQWNTVSISGYHIREAGSTAVQELAFTLADGFHYVDTCLARGMDVDAFAPPAQLLLQRPQRHLRGDRQVPGRPRPLGRGAAAQVRRAQGELVEAALPRPDGRLLAAGQAAGGEPDPRRLPGPGRGAGRLPVAAHQQHGRDAGPAVRTRRHAGPAHAAGAGLRNRRHQHRRSARRQLLRRDADPADAAARPAATSTASTNWAA